MADTTIKSPKKLIETALPLDAINEACAYEKMPGIGAHPRGIHLWWARRPLAACRAVIFSQMVNDPAWKYEMEGVEPTAQQKSAITRQREKLFSIIKDLVVWENTTNEKVLNEARKEIKKSWKETCELNRDHPDAATLFDPEKLPVFHDPFAGGGAIPLEAQRLGLKSYASDLNPVPVIINKAMIEIPPLFAGQKPIHPKDESDWATSGSNSYTGAAGLAEDVAYYGEWMRNEAFKRIGHLYPKVKITEKIISERPDLKNLKGEELTVIAYIWVRTVASPDPAYKGAHVPLASTFVLSKKKGKEAWIEPIVDNGMSFKVHSGAYPKEAENGTKAGSRDGFKCLLSGTAIPFEYLRFEGANGRLGKQLMALVCEGERGRVYLSPENFDTSSLEKLTPTWIPDTETCGKCRVNVGLYGLTTWDKLFTERQLVALSTFCDILPAVIRKVEEDAINAGMMSNEKGVEQKGTGAKAYAQAVGVYLSFAIDRSADFNNTCTRWVVSNEKIMNLFSKQAIPMTWDFGEANILADGVGGFKTISDYIAKCVEKLSGTSIEGFSQQSAAQNQTISTGKVISTDPPYYDNIAYADLSDFFYVWIRHNLRDIYQNLFATMATPKDEELVATPYRQGGKEQAEQFFLNGMTEVMKNLCKNSNAAFPVTIYYAFKQSEVEGNSATSTGWETFLSAVLKAGFMITGTWPLRSEQSYRQISMGSNALASSIVLVCRRRPKNAQSIDLRTFLRELQKTMSAAIEEMTQGSEDQSPVAPVDLSQAIIGPGMAVFSKYKEVLQADGSAMSVHKALRLINATVGSEDDFDSHTQFCIEWYRGNGWSQGQYGQADVLARAKATSVESLQQDLCVKAGQGKLNLIHSSDYKEDDAAIPRSGASVWYILHLCIKMLDAHGTEGAGTVAAIYENKTQELRSLCYRMYTICERLGRMDDAQSYNELMTSWDGIEQSANETKKHKPSQNELDFGE